MITTLVAFSLALAQATQVQPPTRPPGTPADVDAFIAAEMARQHIPGLSLAVVKAGKVVMAKGYGFANVERGEQVGPETVFSIGSTSKQFIATGIMLLAQEGKLTVDDPISKYLAGTPPSWSAITLRNFLTHTSGVRREGPAYNGRKVQADSVVVQSAYADTLLFPTGAEALYCNVCYFALADVIARVSGTPWDVFLTQRVFAPQGMTSTQTTVATPVAPRATGYTWNEKSFLRKARYTVATPNLALRPSGAFRSTVLDLAKWDAALYRDDVLTRASRDAMWAQTKFTNGATHRYGFGWFVDSLYGSRRVRHGGSVNGFRATMTRFPDDSLTVIVLTNSDSAEPDEIADPVAGAYLAEALEQIVQRQPANRSALLRLGFFGAEAGIAPDRAEIALRAFLAIEPTSGRGQGSGYPLAHYRLALIHEQRKDFAKARTELATALQLFPKYQLARDAELRLRGHE